jgi:hypothetical protein
MPKRAAQAVPTSTASSNGISESKLPGNGSPPLPNQRTLLEKAQALASKCIHPWRSFQSHKDKRKRIKKPPEKKAPFNLSLWGLLILLIFEVLILIALAVLWVLTTKHNGFVDVPDTPASITASKNIHERLLWIYSLLWTSVPAFIVTMCGALFATTLRALQDSRPTIELRRASDADSNTFSYGPRKAGYLLPFRRKAPIHQIEEKAKAKHTVLLDYGRDWFPFVDSYHAFQNKHFLISACTIVKWFFVAIGPLAAAIISIGNVPSSKGIAVTTNSFFDDNKNVSSSRLALQSTSAILLNNASSHPWSTDMYSVVPFFANSETPGNLSADTRTFSGTLDCVPISVETLQSAGNLTLVDQVVPTFNFVDRGCPGSTFLTVAQGTPVYANTFYLDCPYEAVPMRLVLLTGVYENTSRYLLGNVSLISCIPYFWKSISRVTVLSAANSLEKPGQILNIVEDKSSVKQWLPSLWSRWMPEITEYRVQDPRLLMDADDFGFITYNYAMNSSGTIDFAQAMNITFSVLFATFSTLEAYSPLPESFASNGTLSRPGNRLFVVFLPATIVTFVMALSFVVTIWISVYAYKHRVILKEHVGLILGHALLLEGNDGVGSFVDAVRADLRRQAEVAIRAPDNKTIKKIGEASSDVTVNLQMENMIRHGDLVQYAEDFGNLKDWDCWVDDDGKLWMREPAPTDNST